MKKNLERQKEKLKITIMAFLLLGACFLTYYFHVLLKTDTVFTHLFYIPIIIASLWWGRKGILVAVFLSGLLIFSHSVFRLEVAILNDFLRASMFITFSFAVALLSEQRVKQVVLLKESEERYRNLVENINDVIFNLDMEGNFTYISPVIEKLFGYKPEEIVNRSFIEYVHPDDLNGLIKSMEQTVTGEQEPYEFRVLKKDGEIRHVRTSSSVQFEEGVPVGLTGVMTDITEHKRAEDTIRESEEKYRVLVENANDGIVFIHDGLIKFVNPRTWEIGGYRVEELIDTSFIDFIHPDEISKIAERHKRRMAGEEVISIYESALKHKDGHKIDVEFNASIFTYKGKPAVQAIIRDITDRKRTEKTLKDSEERYRNLVENINDVIFNLDMEGNFTYISPAIERISKYYKMDELIGQSFTHFVHPEDLPEQQKNFEQNIADIEESREFRVLDKDGDVRHVHISSRMQFEEGIPVGITGVMTDITEHKQAEEEINKFNKLLIERTIELRQSEEKWRTLFETSRDVVYISTVDGKFLDINPTGEELFGYTRNELLELDISKNIYRDAKDREKLQKVIEKEGSIKDYEIDFVKNGGALINVLLTATVKRDNEGHIIGYHGIIRDITERKKMETQFIQTEKLSSLGGILSGVAHELNNPLTAIIGNAQLLARKDISSEIKGKLEVIQRESMRCTKIVGGLLTFAREHKPERKIISVNDVIMESYKLREYELRVDNVDIEMDLQKDIPRTSADPYQLQQVFINLINNAHDALKEKKGGTLNIRSYKKDETILIEFEDNGPGIPKENINKIFDPFFTTKEVGEGTGLGLSIIYGIVHEHDGKMYVESEIDKGAKFTIELPIEKEVEETVEVEMKRPKKPEGTKSVLVVEDEDSLRVLISEVLSNEGYVVDTANRGGKAIELLKRDEYDVIISDMKMPGMSGQNLYTLIQKEYPGLADKILFITGDVLGKETQNFFKTTGVKYIEKPFVIYELLNKLNDLLSN